MATGIKIFADAGPGLELIKKAEGLSLAPYQDDAGIWTIGYGHAHMLYGKPISADTPHITLDAAESLLRSDVRARVEQLNQWMSINNFQLNHNQFGALVSFIFNFDIQRFRKSTLANQILAFKDGRDKEEYRKAITAQFMRWIYIMDPNSGRMYESKGLKNRREMEAELYFLPPVKETADAPDAPDAPDALSTALPDLASIMNQQKDLTAKLKQVEDTLTDLIITQRSIREALNRL